MKNSGIEWIGEIPEHWIVKKIKYILMERIEKNNPIKTTIILSLTAKQGVIPYSEKEGGGNKPKEDLTDYRLAYPGDIVMNSMNVLSGSVGLSKYFGCVSPVYYMLRPITSNEDVRFYNYIFQTSVFQKSLFGLGNGILIKESGNGKLNTIRMRIPMDKLGNLYIPVSSIKEQRSISNYLDEKCGEMDALLADIKEEIETLEQYKRSVITESVTKGLNPSAPMKNSGIEWVGDIPEHWQVTKTRYQFQYKKEIAGIRCDQYERLALTMKNVVKRSKDDSTGLQPEKFETYQILRKDELVFKLIDLQNVSTSRVGRSPYEGLVSPAYIILRQNGKVLPCYAEKYFYVLWKNQVFNSLGDDGVRSNLGKDDLLNIPLPIPPRSEQKAIAEYLDKKCAEIDAVISEKQAQMETLESYKKSLIYEYVTGKKEVG